MLLCRIPFRRDGPEPMCNRYTLIDPDSAFAEIARILGVALHRPEWVTKRYNLGLMQLAPTVVHRDAGVAVMPMQFGHSLPGVGKVVGNARAETIFERRTFRSQTASHRCLVPTTGFIDWETDEQGGKRPHLFTRADGKPYAMAAIWSEGDPVRQLPDHFYIITTTPNELVGRYHDRMPVILPEDRLAPWLEPAPMEEGAFRQFLTSYPAEAMQEREISDFANNVRHEGPECLAPAGPRPDQLGLGF